MSICESRSQFNKVLAAAGSALAENEVDDSAAFLQIAAQFAFSNHTGFFRSPKLEEMAWQIGQKLTPDPAWASSGLSAAKRKILHVATRVFQIGGHTRVIWNWIDQDVDSEHHLALTQHGFDPIPPKLVELTARSGGRIYRLDLETRSLRTIATRLAALAQDFDLIILHIHPFDITPLLAFAAGEQRPPVALFNHADEVFGICGNIPDIFVDFRESGKRLSLTRRKIPELSSFILPLPLGLPRRTLTRAQAKDALGLSAGDLLAVSVGRAGKFQPVGGVDFGEVHWPLLRTIPNLTILVVGPARESALGRYWSARYLGRVQTLGEIPQLATIYQAADLVLDSIPVGSTTAFLDGIHYGTAGLICNPYPGDEGICVCTDDVSLREGREIWKRYDSYQAAALRLLKNERAREEQGEEASRRVNREHTNGAWLGHLSDLYRRLDGKLQQREICQELDQPTAPDSLDLLLAEVLGASGGSPAGELLIRCRFLSRAGQLRYVRRWNCTSKQKLHALLPAAAIRIYRILRRAAWLGRSLMLEVRSRAG